MDKSRKHGVRVSATFDAASDFAVREQLLFALSLHFPIDSQRRQRTESSPPESQETGPLHEILLKCPAVQPDVSS